MRRKIEFGIRRFLQDKTGIGEIGIIGPPIHIIEFKDKTKVSCESVKETCLVNGLIGS